MGSLHSQRCIIERVILEKPVDQAIFAEAYCILIGALHWLVHDRPVADLTAHPPQNSIGQKRSGKECKRLPTPDKKTVLYKKIGKVPPGPEGCRAIGAPFVDQELLDSNAEKHQNGRRKQQSNHRAGNRIYAEPGTAFGYTSLDGTSRSDARQTSVDRPVLRL